VRYRVPAYVVADIEITDPDSYEQYKPLAAQSIKQYGGKVVARGGPIELLEGSWKPSRLVILEFESADAAHRWHNSPEYGAAKGIRQQASRSNVILADET
jgi:uncharacterized protein (DUF1330 family)